MACGSTCLCDACAAPPMGGLLPTVVWPSDVDALKRKYDPDFVATDAAVKACGSKLDAPTAKAWSDFYASWRAFFAESTPLFGSANKYDEANGYAESLAHWQGMLGPLCTLAAPAIVPPSVQAANELDALKWLAGAAIVVAAVYALRTVWR